MSFIELIFLREWLTFMRPSQVFLSVLSFHLLAIEEFVNCITVYLKEELGQIWIFNHSTCVSIDESWISMMDMMRTLPKNILQLMGINEFGVS